MFNFFQSCNVLFSSSYISYVLDFFHNFNCSLLLGVVIFVFLCFIFLFYSFFYYKSFMYNFQFSELICSLLPVAVLFLQMLPSLGLLYYFGFIYVDTDFTVKVVGHQWYWSYDLSDVFVSFDSYMLPVDSLFFGSDRLLEVDSRCILPVDLFIRFCITSADVIHSWTLFNLFIKLDAVSGILSVFSFSFPVVGFYYGQCSEICGANHSFMPVVLELVPFHLFLFWSVYF